MNTLREIGDFVGIPEGAAARTSGPVVGLKEAARLVSLLSDDQRKSMLAMIEGLQNLPPVTLDASLVGDHSGEDPFQPVVRLLPSNSAVIETVLRYAQGGRETSAYDLDVAGGDFHPTQLGPGQWRLTVTRSGVGDTGFVRLERAFDVTVTPQPAPVGCLHTPSRP